MTVLSFRAALSLFAACVIVQPATAGSAYVGAQLGYHWTEGKATNGPVFLNEFDPAQVSLGVFAGYAWQTDGGWTIGLEADANYDFEDDHLNANLVGPPGQFMSSSLDWDASVRTRVGYSFGELTPYVTGGLAIANFDIFAVVTGATASSSNTTTGWTLGGGLEYALSDRGHLRLEYRHSDYADVTHPATVSIIEFKGQDLASDTLRIGYVFDL